MTDWTIDDTARLTDHFRRGEFACKCGCVVPPEYRENIAKLAWTLDTIRCAIAAPVVVISGYRCRARNKEVGGVDESSHLRGAAADIQSVAANGEKLRWLVEALIRIGIIPDGGVGTYRNAPGTLHYDQREVAARWRK